MKTPTVRTAETVTVPTSRKVHCISSGFRVAREDSKNKVLIKISFTHRKKKYMHIARPASAVSQVSPDQQMPPDGQHRAVNCSYPLVVLQVKSLYLGGKVGNGSTDGLARCHMTHT